MATIHKFKPAKAKYECSECGAAASCDCGAKMVPAGTRAAAAIAANPGKSDRAIAAEIGVSDMTVGRARRKAGATNVSPEADGASERRLGRDGKSYSPRKRITSDEAVYEAASRRRVFMQCVADCIRKAEQQAGLADAMGDEIDDQIVAELDRLISAWLALKSNLLKRKENRNA